MTRFHIRKGTALLMAMLVLGTAACGENGTGGTPEAVTPTTAVQSDGESQTSGGQQTGDASQSNAGQNGPAITPSDELGAAVAAIKAGEVTERAARTATVTLSDSGISISGTGCEADGSRLKIKEAGTYEISGTLSNGSIYVNVDNESEVHLILNGVTVHNETSAALFCKKAAKVTITLAEGSVNTLTDGAEYVFEDGADEPDATLYAKHDLVINGTGTLKVTSAYGDAVKGKDSLYILGGTVVVNSVDDGIVGRDLLYIAGGTFDVQAASDTLKSNNDTDAALGHVWIDGGEFALTAGSDGIQAENTLTINDGVFTIRTGNGSVDASASAKGLKATNLLALAGGVFDLDTSDDTFHSDKNIEISGGTFTVMSEDDGAHADESLVISGNAKIDIAKSYEGMEALDITLSGGEVSIVANDEGLNAAGGADGSGFGRPGAGMFGEGTGEIVINGGSLKVNATGDGIDANGSVTVNGGTVLVYGPTNDGNGVLDYGGSFLLNGGTLLCVGSSGMAQVPTAASGQYSLAAVLSSGAAEGSTIEITVGGTTVLSAKAPKQFNYVLASTADFAADADVAVLVNGEECYAGTLTETVTCFGTISGMGGFGGGMGGFGGGFGGGGMGGGFGGGNFGGGIGGHGDKGTRPELPNGEMPEMPELPDGERPELPNL